MEPPRLEQLQRVAWAANEVEPRRERDARVIALEHEVKLLLEEGEPLF